MPNNNRIKLMIFVLTLLTIACVCSPTAFFERQVDNAVENVQETVEAGIGFTLEEVQETAEALAGGEIEFGEDVESEFPISDDATNPVIIAGVLNYASNLSIEELVEFYRSEFTALGYTERTLLTVIQDGTVNLVFDGHPSGNAIIVQMVDLIVLGVNVNVRLEDI